MPLIEVALPLPLPQTFTYEFAHPLPAGIRVQVPFGNRDLVGVVLGEAKNLDPNISLRSIRSCVDESPIFSPAMFSLASWMSAYYMHPIGEVFQTMLPASAKRKIKRSYSLTSKGEQQISLSTPEGILLAQLFKKSKTLSDTSIKTRLKKMEASQNLAILVKKRWITKMEEKMLEARSVQTLERAVLESGTDRKMHTLTSSQENIVKQIIHEGLSCDQSKVFLLHGVTGSGKTEVYLHLIASILSQSQDQQGLVMVPEISLTPQMTRVFEERFPGLVAVVHSMLTSEERWTQLEKIRKQSARILIGPRSAIFGPFHNLKLIIIDEEHDSSYKQGSGLLYNARDIAVMRAKLERATVVLGSATPSLESLNNALLGRYTLLSLPERVNQRPLPEIQLLEQETSKRFGTLVHSAGETLSDSQPPFEDQQNSFHLNPEILDALRENHARGHQAMLIVNRRGYAHYLFSCQKKKPVECPDCSISMTLHARSTMLRCHYCDYKISVRKILEERRDETFIAVGYGSQRTENILKAEIPNAKIARLDSDVVADKQALPQTLADFRSGKIDILVGTQMLAKGHDFPNVTLIAIVEVDQALILPDFRAGERAFQLIVQAAGRAGRANLAGRVMIQTQRSEHPVINAAISQDYRKFALEELEFRKRHHYPPFARLMAIEVTSTNPKILTLWSDKAEAWLENLSQEKPELFALIRVLGPATPPIERIRKRYRRMLMVSSERPEALRSFVGAFLRDFRQLPQDMRLKVDVDPQSLI